MVRNSQICGKWEMHTVGPGLWQENRKKCGIWGISTLWPGIWRETLKNVKKLEVDNVEPGVCREKGKSWNRRTTHGRTWKMARNTQKHGKWEMHMVGPGVWQEN